MRDLAGGTQPRRAAGRSKAATWAGRLAMALGGAVLAGALLEGGLRVAGIGRSFAQPDPTIGFVLTPGYTRVLPIVEHPGQEVTLHADNLSLRRDADLPVAKPPGTKRILVLGDSQTEGIVDNRETYASRIEYDLDAADSAKVEVLNAGTSGYSPLLEYLWLRERGIPLQPDLVVLALYVGNDIAELGAHEANFGGFGPSVLLPSLERRNGSWHLYAPGALRGPFGRIDWLLETQLQTYALLRRIFPRPDPHPGSPMHRIISTCAGCLQTLWQAWMAKGDPGGLGEDFERLAYVLGETKAAARRLGIPLVVAVIPTRAEVERQIPELLGMSYDAAGFDDEIRRRIIASCEAQGIAVIDLLPPLRSAFEQEKKPLYWLLDWHLNVRGHAVVADYLAPRLATRLEHR